MEKKNKPKISLNLEKKSINDEFLEDEIEGYLFSYEKVNKQIKDVAFNGCRFENVDFSSFPLVNVDLIDCVFDSCDLTKSDISSKLFLRCIFNNCKFLGADFIDVIIKHVTFSSSNLEYLNFSSKFTDVSFNECKIKNGRFFDCVFKDVKIDYCDLSDCEIFKTSLNEVDLSTSKIENINSDIESIKGSKVDTLGMFEIARILGIEIKF